MGEGFCLDQKRRLFKAIINDLNYLFSIIRAGGTRGPEGPCPLPTFSKTNIIVACLTKKSLKVH